MTRIASFFLLLVLVLPITDAALHAQDSTAATEAGLTPKKRELYFYGMRSWPFGRIPQHARADAIEQARASLPAYASARRAKRGAAVMATPPVWRLIGPTDVGGRITSIACHPSDGRTLWAAAADGGVWKSSDRGEHWAPVMDNENAIAMGAIAVDPHSPNILYAGTGEMSSSVDAYTGAGLFKSVDGGATWRPVGLTSVGAFSRIVVSPLGSSIVFAGATKNGAGFYRSTDGGNTWTRTFTEQVSDISINPALPDQLWIGTMSKGVFRSDDGGLTFTPANDGLGMPANSLGRVSVQCAPSQPLRLYALAHETMTDSTDATFSNIYRSDDGGEHWSLVYDGGGGRNFTDHTNAPQGWYNNVVAVDPRDPDHVLVGGISLARTTDGGGEWEFTQIMHADQHAIVFDPSEPGTVYLGNDGGVERAEAGLDAFERAAGGMAITQFYAMSIDQSSPTKTYGGTQDNGVISTTSTISQDLLRGDGFYCAVDHGNPNYLMAEVNDGTIARVDIAARSFDIKMDGIDFDDEAAWSAPLVMDPKNARRMWHGRHALYGTEDGAESWVPTTFAFAGHASSIGISPLDGNVVYAGSDRGEIAVSRNGGLSWIEHTTAPGAPNRAVTDFAVSWFDPATCFMSVSGFWSSHVFRTTDYGATWTDIGAQLPDIPVNALALHPDDERTIFAGSDIGMFITTDGGAHWATYGMGLPRVAVADLEVHRGNRVLRMASHGRSMWEIDLETPAPDPEIISPIGGEVWMGGTEHAIHWAGIDPPVKIDLSLDDGGHWQPIGSTVGGFLWSVPDAASERARVRVTSAEDSTRTATSRSFTIERFHIGGLIRGSQIQGTPYGLLFDGHTLWSTDFNSNRLIKLDPNTLATTGFVTMDPTAGDSLFTDLARHPGNGHFYIHRSFSSDADAGGVLVEVDSNGRVYHQWPSPAAYPTGVAYLTHGDTAMFMLVDRAGFQPVTFVMADDPGVTIRSIPRSRRVILGPRGVANGAAASEVYQVITDFGGGSLQSAVAERANAFDLDPDCSVDLLAPAGGSINARGVEFDPRDSTLWVSDFEGNIYKMFSCDSRPKTSAVTTSPDADAAAMLEQNVPNPVTSTAEIAFTLRRAATVRLELFDERGAMVAVLAEGRFDAGRHTVPLDMTGRASGVYRYAISTGNGTGPARMMVVVR